MIISSKKLKIEFFEEPNYVNERNTELKNIFKEFISFFSLDEVNIEVSFCKPVEMQRINKQFRHKDKTTNVLSFPDKDITKISNTCIGEILVCNDVLEKEAAEQNKNVFDHFVHLIIHSMLHMVGYGNF